MILTLHVPPVLAVSPSSNELLSQLYVDPVSVDRLCVAGDCMAIAVGGDRCLPHFRIFRHAGYDARLSPEEERLLRFLDMARYANGHWFWVGAVSRGYGSFHYPGGSSAHRFAWEAYRGPIPDGLQIDHICVRPRCVNPEHLQLCTAAQNQLLKKIRNGKGIESEYAEVMRAGLRIHVTDTYEPISHHEWEAFSAAA